MAISRAEIVAADISHVYSLARTLRAKDRMEVLALCSNVRRAMRGVFRSSFYRRTALVDGDVAAMWGMGCPLLSDTAQVWMLTAPPVERVPVSYARLARQGVLDMLAVRRCLRGLVAADYPEAVGFLQLIGFTIHAPEPHGLRGELFHPITLER